MIRIGNTLISDDVISEFFVCHIEKCKGACCVEGDLGAPLEEEELSLLKQNYEQIEPYLMEEGKAAIREQGYFIKDFEGDYSTPTIDGRECAYAFYNESGILKCGIEQAFHDGKTNWQKPISCHLYPIRISKNTTNVAVNYDSWSICNDACILGRELSVPVYEFLKEPLIRRFGEAWYSQLEAYAKEKKGKP